MDIMRVLKTIFAEYQIPHQLPEKCNAQYISEQLQIKRNTASKHLNQLVSEGEVLKINTRPVLFLPKKIVEEQLGRPLKETEFSSFEALLTDSTRDFKQEVFSDVIGYQDSLKEIIDQSISALRYPGGLPLLLLGNSGVGKSYLAEKMFEYAQKSGIIAPEAKFLELNCAQYYNNPELLTSQLFGYVKGAFTGADTDQKGIIENADGGIVFLDEIHRLPPAGQEKLFLHMDKGVFRRIGDTEGWRESKVHYIFATTEEADETFLETFLRRIPMVCRLPDYADRSLAERKDILFHIFEAESQIIGKSILTTEALMDFLLKFQPKGNIGEVSGLIKRIVAQKYNQQLAQSRIEVELLDLPAHYLDQVRLNRLMSVNQKKKYIFVEGNYIHHELSDVSFNRLRAQFFQQIKQGYRNYLAEQIGLTAFEDYIELQVSTFCDQFSYTAEVENIVNYFLPDLQNIFQSITPNIFIEIKGTTIQKIAAYFVKREVVPTEQLSLTEEDQALYQLLESHLPKESRLVFTIIANSLDIELTQWDKLFIYLCLFSEANQDQKRINGIILAHGFATASSIANVANRLVQQHVFDSIDMPLSSSPQDVLQKLVNYIERIEPQEGLLILVDMGSLAMIREDIAAKITVPTVIINNVSTELALNAAFKITQQQNLEKIATTLPVDSQIFSELLLPQNQQKKALVVSCSTGLGTAIKIKEMFEQFLPPELELEVLPYETATLQEMDTDSLLFQSKEIIAIIGTDDPTIANIPYISLEELFEGNAGRLYQVFDQLFGSAIAQKVDEQIVKNLSLNRLIDSLTILDAVKVMEQLAECFVILEKNRQEKLTTAQKINLYVHLSCLIERLVRNQPVTSFPNLEGFIATQSVAIQQIKSALKEIERLYNIQVPLEEIGYIYNIITQL